MAKMITDALIQSVKRHESWRGDSYKDSEGVWTVGWGTNLETLEDFPEGFAEFFLKRELVNAAYALSQRSAWHELTQTRREVLIEMAYNLGMAGVNGFKKMWTAIDHGNYEEAADQMLDSKWANQVGVRAIRLAKKMRSGISG
jgi:lysozyme